MKHWFWIACVWLIGCSKTEQTASHDADNNNSALVRATEEAGDDWVWVANQATGKIEIYDPAIENWNDETVKWSWKPTAAKGYSTYALDHWDVPNDFKVRNIPAWGGNFLTACASGGLCTIATYPAGVKRWAYNIGDTVYPHSVELLPDGNIAVAATKQNAVKVFMSGSSDTSTVSASFRLVGAHSVMWDRVTSTIRAIGNDHIVSLQLGGTVTAPTLTEVYNARGYLVNGGASLFGHDLSPDLNDTNILWCSTNGGAYSFNKTTKLFTIAPGGATTGVGKTWIKGISRQNSGIFVITRPDSQKSPAPTNPVLTPNWCTRYVDFYSPTGSFLYYRRIDSAKIYKAKVFRTPY